MEFNNKLFWLNMGNGAAEKQVALLEKILTDFPKDKLTTLEVGSPYGGAVEFAARLMGKRGTAYGYDTFEGHPVDLADDPDSSEAHAMDQWYARTDYTPEMLTYEYQRKVLDEEGLSNAILVKGRLNEHSFDDIKKAHLVMLDLDLIKPTILAYDALKDKIVKGGYLMTHDSFPADHLPLIYDFVHNVIAKDGRWMIVGEYDRFDGFMTVLQRI